MTSWISATSYPGCRSSSASSSPPSPSTDGSHVISGRATPAGTRRRAGEHPGYRRLGRTDLTVSLVGFGGYRTGTSNPDHRAALEAALAAGVNLIDTSSNYMLGDS